MLQKLIGQLKLDEKTYDGGMCDAERKTTRKKLGA